MRQQGRLSLGRHRHLHPHYLCFWWKVVIYLSSSSLTLSPTFHRPISRFAPIVAQAAFYSSPSKINIDRRRTPSMTLFPVTPLAGTMSSSYESTGGISPHSGSSIRRSSRIINKNRDDITQRKGGVRLFQERSVDISSNDISNDDDGSDVPVTRSKKRDVARRSSSNIDDLAGKTAKQKRPGISPTASTPARGSNAVPVTPEPVVVENNSGSTRSSRKKTETKVEGKTKTARVKSKTKSKTKTKTKTTAKRKQKSSRVLASWPAPDGWRETYELVRELRKDKTAPCDIMGAEALALTPPGRNDNVCIDKDADADDNAEEDAKTSRFQTLIALMLSSQTKDAMVAQAMANLRDTSDGSGGLTVASILKIDPKVLNSKIYSVGFRNNKTKYIKQVAQVLHDDYNGDIPPTAGDMIRDLSGVGPKMAFIVENVCWDKQSGIGVDTHMQRLFPKLGWVSPDTKNPEQTRRQLESWLPPEYWGEVNLLWVGFGQEVQQEKQKVLRKALQSGRPFEALSLLRSVDFDVNNEWNKMKSVYTPASDDKKQHVIWADDNEKEEISIMIEEVMMKK